MLDFSQHGTLLEEALQVVSPPKGRQLQPFNRHLHLGAVLAQVIQQAQLHCTTMEPDDHSMSMDSSNEEH